MQHSRSKLILMFGLSAALALPGLAMAENRTTSFKYAVQQGAAHRGHENVRQVRDDRHGYREHHGRHDKHKRYERHDRGHQYGHQHHYKHQHDYYRGGRWGYIGQGGHHHQGRYCNISHGHAHRHGGHISGYYVSPQLGLHIVLR